MTVEGSYSGQQQPGCFKELPGAVAGVWDGRRSREERWRLLGQREVVGFRRPGGHQGAPSSPAPTPVPCPWGVPAKGECFLLLAPEVERDLGCVPIGEKPERCEGLCGLVVSPRV